MLINSRFKIGSFIGRGSFGDIYHGVNVQTGAEVALKIEKKPCQLPQLHNEIAVYQALFRNGSENSIFCSHHACVM